MYERTIVQGRHGGWSRQLDEHYNRWFVHMMVGAPAQILMVRRLLSLAQIDIVCDDVSSEGNYSNAKPGEKIAKHDAVGEDGVFTPGLPFCPWISKEWKVGHL